MSKHQLFIVPGKGTKEYPQPVQENVDYTSHNKSNGNGGGGGVEDLSRRVTNLEHQVGEIRTDVATIKATMPSLATKDQVAILPQLATKDSVAEIKAILPYLATKSELEQMHSSLIKWIVGAGIGSGSFIAAIVFGLIKIFN